MQRINLMVRDLKTVGRVVGIGTASRKQVEMKKTRHQ
jgi:hypothetical protein